MNLLKLVISSQPLWNEAKNLASKIKPFFISTINFDRNERLQDAIMEVLMAEFQLYHGPMYEYWFSGVQVDRPRKWRSIPYKIPTEWVFFVKGSEIIRVFLAEGEDLHLQFIRGTVDIDRIVSKASKLYNEALYGKEDPDTLETKKPEYNNFYITTEVGRGFSNSGMYSVGRGLGDVATTETGTGNNFNNINGLIGGSTGGKKQISLGRYLEKYKDFLLDKDMAPRLIDSKEDSQDFAFKYSFYPEHILSHIRDLKTWLSEGTWYQERGIPWRRGVLLYGPGGTGKSTLAVNIAKSLGIPLFSVKLSTFTDIDLIETWNNLKKTTCVILLEDIDAVFHGRKNITGNKEGVTFDCLLNLISGVEPTQTANLLIVTTNQVEHIDEALGAPIEGTTLSTRPGRIDLTLYLGPMEDDERHKLVSSILRDWPEDVERIFDNTKGFTASQVQETCIQLAFEKLV